MKGSLPQGAFVARRLPKPPHRLPHPRFHLRIPPAPSPPHPPLSLSLPSPFFLFPSFFPLYSALSYMLMQPARQISNAPMAGPARYPRDHPYHFPSRLIPRPSRRAFPSSCPRPFPCLASPPTPPPRRTDDCLVATCSLQSVLRALGRRTVKTFSCALPLFQVSVFTKVSLRSTGFLRPARVFTRKTGELEGDFLRSGGPELGDIARGKVWKKNRSRAGVVSTPLAPEVKKFSSPRFGKKSVKTALSVERIVGIEPGGLASAATTRHPAQSPSGIAHRPPDGDEPRLAAVPYPSAGCGCCQPFQHRRPRAVVVNPTASGGRRNRRREPAKIPVASVSEPEVLPALPPGITPLEDPETMGQIGHDTHMLFIDAFLQNNRLDHVTQVIGYHPTYLDVFLRTQNFILRGDGPLPYDYRHFIAIMAAGRHQCSYLINLQKQEFLLQGGDPTWLKGLSQIPQKLRDLYDINKILAHRPWLLNKSHIEKLTKGKDSWSLAEVVHAIVLLAHFHSLSSFVFGCGVNEELDRRTTLASPTSDDSAATHLGGRRSPTLPTANSEHVNSTSTNVREASSPIPTGSPNSLTSSLRYGPARSPVSHNGEVLLVSGNAGSGELEAVGVETLMQRMKSLSERAEEFSAEERTKRFEHVESQSAELLLSPAGMLSSTQVKADIGQFVDDPTFLYQDFARRGEMGDIPTFRVQDYSWDDHGYSLVNRLYNDVGNLLDEKFKTAYNLTYYTMGGRKDVDTSRFRRAIWNYIQCMFGIRHDDYDYGEVNQLLERSLKAFIKSACCFPERVTKKDYDSVLREFKHSEKVHVNLMVLEARMQAELLYALRAVMRYMT